MMRSMFSGVSGLRSHQEMMDVVGDNIANINTPGFKASRVIFEDTLSQLLRSGSAASNGQGGVNPQQVGLGVRVGAVDVEMTQGPIQNTGNPTDVAIQGDGFFVVRSGTQQQFTRAGAFNFDNTGNLTDPTGCIVQGWVVDAKGNLSTTGPAGDIKLPLGQAIPPQATTTVTLGGNLSADTTTTANNVVNTAEDVYDSLGTSHRVTFTFTKNSATDWNLEAFDDSNPPKSLGSTTLSFDGSGNLTSPTTPPQFTLPGGNGAQFSVDLGTVGTPQALTQFGGETTVSPIDQDGSSTGYLRSFAIADDGTVSGVFSNGRSKILAQLAMASFTNPQGLVKAGEGHYLAANGSGQPNIGKPGTVGRGTLAAGALEMSNVDLSQEFTNLIIAQRGFQANGKVITTSDEMLSDLVNLKQS